MMASVTAEHLLSSEDESAQSGFYAGHGRQDTSHLLLYCDSGQLR